MKTQLLVICAASGVGSCEHTAFQLTKQMKAMGHSVQTLVSEPVRRREMLSWYSKAKLPVATSIHINPSSRALVPTSILSLAHKIRSYNPSAVNLHYPNTAISYSDVKACRMAGVRKVVVSVHQAAAAESLAKSWSTSNKSIAKSIDWVAVTSQALEASILGTGIPEKKLLMIPMGIEVPEDAPDKLAARSSLRLPKDAFIVGAHTKLTQDKRIDQVIRACAESKEFKKRGFLVVAGDGPERSRLEPLAAQLLPSQNKFIGPLDDPGMLYSCLDVYASMAQTEGFGFHYIEVGAWGVPSIACDVGGTRFAVLDGETGLLVPVDKPQELAEKLDFLINDEDVLKLLGAKAKAFAEKNFSMRKMAKAYEAALGLGR